MIRQLVKNLIHRIGYRAFRRDSFDKKFVAFSRWGVKPGPFLRHFIKTDEIAICFDAGANIGQTAKLFSALFPAATIYSFEPVSTAYAKLVAETARIERVIPMKIALGDCEGKSEMFVNDDAETNSLVSASASDGSTLTETVRITTIDQVMADRGVERIHLLKTDTEGYDLKVLAGAENAFRNESVDLVYCEVGFNEADRGHTFFYKVLEYLQGRGFHFAGLFESAFFNRPPQILYANALFVHRNSQLTIDWED